MLSEHARWGAMGGVLIAAREVGLAALTLRGLSILTVLAQAALMLLGLAVVGALAGVVLSIGVSCASRIAVWATRGRAQAYGLPVWVLPAMVLLMLVLGARPGREVRGIVDFVVIVTLACTLGPGLVSLHRDGRMDLAWVLPGSVLATLVLFTGLQLASGIHSSVLPGGVALLSAAAALGLTRVAAAVVRWGPLQSASKRTRWRAALGIVSGIALLSLSAQEARELAHLRSPRPPFRMPQFARGAGPTPQPSLVLISVDTLRPDYLGCLGGVARTPTIDRIVAQSVLFEHCYSVAPWTRPSFASFFSGRYPSTMAVARAYNRGGGEPIPFRWSEHHPVIAELLRNAGYATYAVVTNPNLTRESGADRGFEEYFHCSRDTIGSKAYGSAAQEFANALHRVGFLPARPDLYQAMERADVVSRAALSAIGRLPNDSFLLWLHYMDPHSPYDPPSIPAEARQWPGTAAMAGLGARSIAERSAITGA